MPRKAGQNCVLILHVRDVKCKISIVNMKPCLVRQVRYVICVLILYVHNASASSMHSGLDCDCRVQL